MNLSIAFSVAYASSKFPSVLQDTAWCNKCWENVDGIKSGTFNGVISSTLSIAWSSPAQI
jgi:hypothetical protein